jgi:hypothetical protein
LKLDHYLNHRFTGLGAQAGLRSDRSVTALQDVIARTNGWFEEQGSR